MVFDKSKMKQRFSVETDQLMMERNKDLAGHPTRTTIYTILLLCPHHNTGATSTTFHKLKYFRLNHLKHNNEIVIYF